MTEQEAIKSMENIIKYWTYRPTEVESAKMAIEALKKQVPKKPIKEVYGNFTMYKCPNCKYALSSREHNYCLHCGQKLDF